MEAEMEMETEKGYEYLFRTLLELTEKCETMEELRESVKRIFDKK